MKLTLLLAAALIGAEDPSHVPIHKLDRVFQPDDIRRAFNSSQELSTIKDIVRKLDSDPKKLEKLANMADWAQRISPDRLQDMASMSPAFRGIAEKLKDSSFREKLMDDPSVRRAAKRLSQKPAMREIVKRMADVADNTTPGRSTSSQSGTPSTSPSKPGSSSADASRSRREGERSRGDFARQAQKLKREVARRGNEKNSAPTKGRSIRSGASEPSGSEGRQSTRGAGRSSAASSEAPVGSGVRKSPLSSMLPQVDWQRSEAVMEAVKRIDPSILSRFQGNKSDSKPLIQVPEGLSNNVQEFSEGMASRMQGVRQWGQGFGEQIQERVPALSFLKMDPSKWNLPQPAAPQFTMPNVSSGQWAQGWNMLPTLLIGVGIVAVIFVILGQNRSEILQRTKRGRQRVLPSGASIRDRIQYLFELLAIDRIGDVARAQNHWQIASQLAHGSKGKTATEFAQLYELARYAPADEPVTSSELERAHQYVAHLREIETAANAMKKSDQKGIEG